MRRTLRLLVGLLVVGAAALGGAAPATGHAALVGTDPEDGASLSALPSRVTLEFNEPVGSSSDVAVTAPDGSSVEVADVGAVDREVTASVGDSGVRGDHVIAYRVVSADGHPVSGQITVTVTEGEEPDATVAQATRESFVHRHREHLLWGGLAAVVALGLVVAPLLARRRS